MFCHDNINDKASYFDRKIFCCYCIFILFYASYVYFSKLYYIHVPWHFKNKLLLNGIAFCIHLTNINTTFITGTLMRHVTMLGGGVHFLCFRSLDGDSDAKVCLPARRLPACLVSRSRLGEEAHAQLRWSECRIKWQVARRSARSITAPHSTCGHPQWWHLALLNSHTWGFARPTSEPRGSCSAGIFLRW